VGDFTHYLLKNPFLTPDFRQVRLLAMPAITEGVKRFGMQIAFSFLQSQKCLPKKSFFEMGVSKEQKVKSCL
jgi:hypothetical protein